MLALPLGDMCNIYHIHCFDLGWKSPLSPSVRLARLFIVILTRRLFPLMLGFELIGLFKDPTISVGMISRLVRGAMNLARPVECTVQTGWTILVSFEWLLPLSRFGAAESGIDRCVFGIVITVSALVLVASWSTVAVFDFGGARAAGVVASTS